MGIEEEVRFTLGDAQFDSLMSMIDTRVKERLASMGKRLDQVEKVAGQLGDAVEHLPTAVGDIVGPDVSERMKTAISTMPSTSPAVILNERVTGLVSWLRAHWVEVILVPVGTGLFVYGAFRLTRYLFPNRDPIRPLPPPKPGRFSRVRGTTDNIAAITRNLRDAGYTASEVVAAVKQLRAGGQVPQYAPSVLAPSMPVYAQSMPVSGAEGGGTPPEAS